MQVLPQERPLDLIAGGSPGQNILDNPNQLLSQTSGTARNDSIARLGPPSIGVQPGQTGSGFNPLGFMGMGAIQTAISSILGMLQQLMQMLGGGSGVGPDQSGGGEQFYGNATGSSTGDPHLAFNGTTGAGQTDNGHFDNMNGQYDLLDSDSFDGGYQISTQTTAPNANGITFNSNAAISTQNGAVQVSLDKAGDAYALENGNSTTLQAGQTLDLGDGETARRAQDGSLTVVDNNGSSGQITTTMRSNGQGVDVNASAQNVDLGGDLYNQTISQEQPPISPPSTTLPNPWQRTLQL